MAAAVVHRPPARHCVPMDIDSLVPGFLTQDMATVRIRHAHQAPATKFEAAQVIGHRASEIAQGAVPRARPVDGSTEPIKIARAEFDARVIQGVDVVRTLPDGSKVVIDVADLPRTVAYSRPW